MYDEQINEPAKANTSDLNEEWAKYLKPLLNFFLRSGE